ncbi:MAG: MotA/TolQ/ExbB proton channel family protein [Deltaproteobacteria bacterium]|nr:MotA/TolQ/ExbB proton channel family protein [Deltaproteobacteria bacterium]
MIHLLAGIAGTGLADASLVDNIHQFFSDGGTFMYVNIASSAVALAIIVERSYSLLFRYSLNAPPFMEQITKLVMTNNIDRAVKLCGAAPAAALSKVVRSGLTRANRGELEVAKAVEESILEVNPLLSKRIASLWSLANIATLLGLIGTITGLIHTFHSLGAISDPAQKAKFLSNGLSEAMNNTAFGLGIAVTCMIGHLLLTNRAKNMIEEIEINALKLENLLSRRGAGEGDLEAKAS